MSGVEDVFRQEIRAYMDRMFSEAMEEARAELRRRRDEEFVSITSVCKMLDVDRSTLYRWKKRGYLVPIQIGGKVRYKKSEIETKTGGDEK